MNVINAQKEIFNAMLKGERVTRFEVNENEVFISPNGYNGYVIPYSAIQINLAKIRECNALNLQKVVTDENRFNLTNECLIQQIPKRILRKLTNGKRAVYFDEKLLKCFQNPQFYNAAENQMIVLTEKDATNENRIVGIIMPHRISHLTGGVQE